jgi:hypothetical protein
MPLPRHINEVELVELPKIINADAATATSMSSVFQSHRDDVGLVGYGGDVDEFELVL